MNFREYLKEDANNLDIKKTLSALFDKKTKKKFKQQNDSFFKKLLNDDGQAFEWYSLTDENAGIIQTNMGFTEEEQIAIKLLVNTASKNAATTFAKKYDNQKVKEFPKRYFRFGINNSAFLSDGWDEEFYSELQKEMNTLLKKYS